MLSEISFRTLASLAIAEKSFSKAKKHGRTPWGSLAAYKTSLLESYKEKAKTPSSCYTAFLIPNFL